MRKIKEIVIHHSDSNFGNYRMIDEWHKNKGNKGIGYHFMILNGYLNHKDFTDRNLDYKAIGKVEKGKNIDEIVKHAKGYDSNSIGICLVHKDLPYKDKQLEAYRELTIALAKIYNIALKNIRGHYEVCKSNSLCPGMDMNEERKILKEMINNITDYDMNYLRISYLI